MNGLISNGFRLRLIFIHSEPVIIILSFYFTFFCVIVKFYSTFVAKKYEAVLLEKVGKGLTEDRILLVFQIFDQIIPQLGVFSKVIKKIRNEIFGKIQLFDISSIALFICLIFFACM